MLDERQKSIEDSLLSAEKARKELEGINEESETILAKARNEAQAIVTDAKSAAEKLKEDIVSKAKSEADGQLEKAKIKSIRKKIKLYWKFVKRSLTYLLK